MKLNAKLRTFVATFLFNSAETNSSISAGAFVDYVTPVRGIGTKELRLIVHIDKTSKL